MCKCGIRFEYQGFRKSWVRSIWKFVSRIWHATISNLLWNKFGKRFTERIEIGFWLEKIDSTKFIVYPIYIKKLSRRIYDVAYNKWHKKSIFIIKFNIYKNEIITKFFKSTILSFVSAFIRIPISYSNNIIPKKKEKKVIVFFNRINFNFKVINFRENIDLCQHFAGLFKTMAIKTNFLVYNNNCVLWQ